MTQAWFFSKGFTLAHGDGRKIAVGVTHTVEKPLKLCKQGLHASVKAIDALRYAPGPILWRVELGGEILDAGDKLCAETRRYVLGGFDASDVLRAAARRFALDVAHLWACPRVVRRYLETGDEALREKAYKAASAASSSAYSAYSAYCAYCAAYSSVYSTYCAAYSSVYSYSAAKEKQNAILESMLWEAISANAC